MTFDEAIKDVKSHDDTYDETSGTMQTFSVLQIIDELKEEYAPTIEMTKDQKDLVLFYKENTWFSVFIGKLNDPDNPVYNSLPSLLAFKNWGFEKERESQLMQAWLHPETIKVVDE